MEIRTLLFGHLLTDKVLGQRSWACGTNNGVRSVFNTATRIHSDDVAHLESGSGPGSG